MSDTKKIVFLDIETTGTDTVNDRIVQIAAMKTNAEFTEREAVRKYLINPGVPIPAAATAVHGITDEMVQDKPVFERIAKGFLEYVNGCDVCGFNILDFDVPLLSEEINRAGLHWNTKGINFYDSYRIFREKEKRDLSAAMVFYTGNEHTGAHDAAEDIMATAAVFSSQLKRYQDLGAMEPAKLAEFCAGGRALDLAGKILLNDAGVPCYSFGQKTKGVPVLENIGFANWMIKKDSGFTTNTKDVVKKLLGYYGNGAKKNG